MRYTNKLYCNGIDVYRQVYNLCVCVCVCVCVGGGGGYKWYDNIG